VIVQVPPDEIAPFASIASRDRIQLKLGAKAPTIWFAAKTRSGAILGFAALAHLAEDHWRHRAVWVRPDARGEGHSVALLDAHIEYLREHAPEANVSLFHNKDLEHSFYFDRGFQDTGIRQSGSGAWFLQGLVKGLTTSVD